MNRLGRLGRVLGAIWTSPNTVLGLLLGLVGLARGARCGFSDGALVWLDGGPHHIPPATNNLVDATGAGDSFAGAFLARHLAGATPLAAATFADLGTRFPATRYEAWFAAGELFEKQLKDPARARDAYAKVPAGSSRYEAAQKKLASGQA